MAGESSTTVGTMAEHLHQVLADLAARRESSEQSKGKLQRLLDDLADVRDELLLDESDKGLLLHALESVQQRVRRWLPEFGCAIQVRDLLGSFCTLEVIGLDRWKKVVKMTGPDDNPAWCTTADMASGKHSVFEVQKVKNDQVEDIVNFFESLVSRAQCNTGDRRNNSSGNGIGLQRTPGFVADLLSRAALHYKEVTKAEQQEEGLEGEILKPKGDTGGCTDVGQHTGVVQRSTVWPLVLAAIHDAVAVREDHQSGTKLVARLNAALALWHCQFAVKIAGKSSRADEWQQTLLNAQRALHAVPPAYNLLSASYDKATGNAALIEAANKVAKECRDKLDEIFDLIDKTEDSPGPDSPGFRNPDLIVCDDALRDLDWAHHETSGNDATSGAFKAPETMEELRERMGQHLDPAEAHYLVQLFERDVVSLALQHLDPSTAEMACGDNDISELLAAYTAYSWQVPDTKDAAPLDPKRALGWDAVARRSRRVMVSWIIACLAWQGAESKHAEFKSFGLPLRSCALAYLASAWSADEELALVLVRDFVEERSSKPAALGGASSSAGTWELAKALGRADDEVVAWADGFVRSKEKDLDARWEDTKRRQAEVQRLKGLLSKALAELSEANGELSRWKERGNTPPSATIRNVNSCLGKIRRLERDIDEQDRAPEWYELPVPEERDDALAALVMLCRTKYFLRPLDALHLAARAAHGIAKELPRSVDLAESFNDQRSRYGPGIGLFRAAPDSHRVLRHGISEDRQIGTLHGRANSATWATRTDNVKGPVATEYRLMSRHALYQNDLWAPRWDCNEQAMRKRFTPSLGHREAQLWLQLDETIPNVKKHRGNEPIAMPGLLGKSMSHEEQKALAALRVTPFQQVRRAIAALRDGCLPLSREHSVDTAVFLRMVLQQLGTCSDEKDSVADDGGDGESAERFAGRLRWRQDINEELLEVAGRMLGHAAEQLRENETLIWQLPVLATVAATLGRTRACARAVRQLAEAAQNRARLLDDSLKSLLRNQSGHSNKSAAIDENCVRQCFWLVLAMLCLRGVQLTTQDAERLVWCHVRSRQRRDDLMVAEGEEEEEDDDDDDDEGLQFLDVVDAAQPALRDLMARKLADIERDANREGALASAARAALGDDGAQSNGMPWTSAGGVGRWRCKRPDGKVVQVDLLRGIVLLDGRRPGRLPRDAREAGLVREHLRGCDFEVRDEGSSGLVTVNMIGDVRLRFKRSNDGAWAVIEEGAKQRLQLLGRPCDSAFEQLPVHVVKYKPAPETREVSVWADLGDEDKLVVRGSQYHERHIRYVYSRKSGELLEVPPHLGATTEWRELQLDSLRRVVIGASWANTVLARLESKPRCIRTLQNKDLSCTHFELPRFGLSFEVPSTSEGEGGEHEPCSEVAEEQLRRRSSLRKKVSAVVKRHSLKTARRSSSRTISSKSSEATLPKRDGPRSLEFPGFVLVQDQALGSELGGQLRGLRQFVVLRHRTTDAAIVLIPEGMVSVEKDLRVSIELPEDSLGRCEAHKLDIHPRFKALQASPESSRLARLRLAALHVACGAHGQLMVRADQQLTGAELAMEELRCISFVYEPSETELKAAREVRDLTRGIHAGLWLLADETTELLASVAVLHQSVADGDEGVDDETESKPDEDDKEEEEEEEGIRVARRCARDAVRLEQRRSYLLGRGGLRPDETMRLGIRAPTWVEGVSAADGTGGKLKDATDAAAKRLREAQRRLDSMVKAEKKPKTDSSANFDLDLSALHGGRGGVRRSIATEVENDTILARDLQGFCLASSISEKTISGLRESVRRERKGLHKLITDALVTPPKVVRQELFTTCCRPTRIGWRQLLRLGARATSVSDLNPWLLPAITNTVEAAVCVWLQMCVLEDKLGRLIPLLGEASAEEALLIELRSRRDGIWDVDEYPEWLVFEVEQQIQVRPVQAKVAKQVLAAETPITTQLNVGLGKTRVILPLVALRLLRHDAREHHTASAREGLPTIRLHLLRQLLFESCRALISSLGGSVLACPLYRVPWTRESLGKAGGQVCLGALDHVLNALRGRAALQVTTPEERQSAELKCGQFLDDGSCPPSELQDLILPSSSKVVDLFDECDLLLHHRYRLVYACGDSEQLPGLEPRVLVIQEALAALQELFECDDFEGVLHEKVRVGGQEEGCARTLRLCGTNREQRLELLWRIAQRVLERIELPTAWVEAAVDATVSLDSIALPAESSERSRFLMLRGLLADGVLLTALVWRNRINYGVPRDPVRMSHGRELYLAVPYRAHEEPAPKADFAHPDLSLVLTHLAHLDDGMREGDLYRALEALQRCSTAIKDREWTAWQAAAPKLGLEHRQVNLTDNKQFETELKPHLLHNRAAIMFWLRKVVLPDQSKYALKQVGRSAFHLVHLPRLRGDDADDFDANAGREHVVVGFSGTNDNSMLLPHGIKRARAADAEAAATNGMMVMRLLSKIVAEVNVVESSWDSVLQVAMDQKVQAIIDAGALLIGTTLLDAARWLLSPERERRLTSVTVFIDNAWLVVSRRSDNSISTKRLSSQHRHGDDTMAIFDQARCRGADLKLSRKARALLTLGPSTTKDELMQAAGRMRELHAGQRLVLAATDDIVDNIQATAARTDAAGVLVWAITNTARAQEVGLLQLLQNATLAGDPPPHELLELDLERLYGSRLALRSLLDKARNMKETAEDGGKASPALCSIFERIEGLDCAELQAGDGALGEEVEREMEHEDEKEAEVEVEVVHESAAEERFDWKFRDVASLPVPVVLSENFLKTVDPSSIEHIPAVDFLLFRGGTEPVACITSHEAARLDLKATASQASWFVVQWSYLRDSEIGLEELKTLGRGDPRSARVLDPVEHVGIAWLNGECGVLGNASDTDTAERRDALHELLDSDLAVGLLKDHVNDEDAWCFFAELRGNILELEGSDLEKANMKLKHQRLSLAAAGGAVE